MATKERRMICCKQVKLQRFRGALCTTGIRYGACRIGAASLVSQTLPDNPDTLPKSKDLDAKFSTQVHANCGYLRTRIYQSIMFLTKNCVKLKANSPLSAIQNRSWNWPWKVWCGRYLHSSLSSGSQRRAEPSFRLQKPARRTDKDKQADADR
ncbi:uncharacterized protein [Watersipora subatra]|uniref:uncharacterized protein n=1 Tax=Watersipora subatra TaxID=2589382 RepID=UPI00355C0100